MHMPDIVSTIIADEIHNRVVAIKVKYPPAGPGGTKEHTVRVYFSDIGISSGIFPSDDKALIEYAERALALRCDSVKSLSNVTEIRLTTSNALG